MNVFSIIMLDENAIGLVDVLAEISETQAASDSTCPPVEDYAA